MPAAAGLEGYRVTNDRMLLGQIAKELYMDERQWKEIAAWNGLQPPYTLTKGQILVLLQPPERPASEANRVSLEELPALPTNTKWPSVTRKIEKGIYVVNERAPSLYMVARDLYGDIKMASEIARWNQLPSNAKLALGQRLRIEKKPVLSEKQGTAILVEQWRERDNPMMVSRLGAKMYRMVSSTPSTPKKNSKPVKEQIVCVPASQVISRNKSKNRSQSTVSGPPSSSGNSSSSSDGGNDRIPSSHKPPNSVSDFEKGIEPRNENYWLGDHAEEFLDSLSKKVNPTNEVISPKSEK